MVVQAGDRLIGRKVLLPGERRLCNPGPVAAKGPSRNRIALKRCLLLQVLILKLRLGRVDDIGVIRRFILLDIGGIDRSRSDRSSARGGKSGRSRIIAVLNARGIIRCSNAGVLLRIDRSDELPGVRLIRGRSDILRLARDGIILSHHVRGRRSRR